MRPYLIKFVSIIIRKMAHIQDIWGLMGDRENLQNPVELRGSEQVEDALAAAEGSAARINACIVADISMYEKDAEYYKKMLTSHEEKAVLLATATRDTIYALREDVYRYKEAAITYRERLCEQEKRFIEQQRLTGVACTALAMVHEEMAHYKYKDLSTLH